MSWEIEYVCVCNICGTRCSLETAGGRTPTGWKVNHEGEHVCPDCWTQNKELHPKGVVWPSTRV
jgi:hypothetical protein